MQCFVSDGKSVSMRRISKNQLDILVSQPFIKGLRQRVNYPLPADESQQQFFSFGREFSILIC